MTLPAVQLLAVVFALVMAYFTYVGFRRHQLGRGGLVLWETIWIALIVVSLLPWLFTPIAKTLHLARLMDLVVVGGMLTLGAVVYRCYVLIEQLRSQVERLVREGALAQLASVGSDTGATEHHEREFQRL